MEKKIYRVYTDGIEGEYTEGYIELTEEQLKELDCRDSDYQYEEVVASSRTYIKQLKEVKENRKRREQKEREYDKWLEENPKERERIEKKNAERKQLLDRANGDIRKMMELNGKFMAEDIEESMFSILN
ncbi:MAG TPA: hypothetical protein PLA45_02405 [Candidatus Dojkabacteria bacterium]|nr:hypothetical protein [Candidatus Dojkabacteria bacterium]